MKMKTQFVSLAAGITLALTASVSRAEFETWKNKDGKAAELEIVDVTEGGGGTQVLFRTKAGKEVVFKIEGLAAEDQVRAKEWKESKTLRASFGYATTQRMAVAERGPEVDPSKRPFLFVFDLKGDFALPMSALKISNGKLVADGKTLEVAKWSGVVDGGYSQIDPLNTPPPGPPARKWALVVKAEGDFGEVDPSTCEMSVDVEVMCGKSPKEVNLSMALPKAENFTDDGSLQRVEQAADPFTILMGAAYWPLPGAKDNSEGKVTGYQFTATLDPAKLSLGDEMANPEISRAFVVDGKAYPWSIAKDKVKDPANLVVKYWSEAHTMPLTLSKAAADKGKPPVTEGE